MKRSLCLKLFAAITVLFVGASLAVAQTRAGSNPPSQKIESPMALPGGE
jgi:hypothetical protein